MAYNLIDVTLYAGVKADPSYKQLRRVDLNNARQVTKMADATTAKLTQPLRLNLGSASYMDAYQSNYGLIHFDAPNSKDLYIFITDVNYVNNQVVSVNYSIDYYNTYYKEFNNSSLFVEQTSASIDSLQGNLDTSTLDHTTPVVRLTSQTIHPVKQTVEVYYYDTAGELRGNAPQVSASWNNTDNKDTPLLNTTFSSTGLTFTGDSNKYITGLKHASFSNLADLISNPDFYNSDGSSKIVYTELHEHYQNTLNDDASLHFDLSQAFNDNNIINRQNPFIKYVLTIGGTNQEIPSRFMTDGQSLNVQHQYYETPGYPDLFKINPQTGAVDNNTLNIAKLKKPLVLNGIWSIWYKQHNRLDAKVKEFINNLYNDVLNFPFNFQQSKASAAIAQNYANQAADLNQSYSIQKLQNDNKKASEIIAYNLGQDKNNLSYSQNIARQQIANTLTTSIDNTNKTTDTSIKNLEASQSVQISNLDKSNSTKKANLKTNQEVQKTNLENNFNTSNKKIDLSTLDSFFKSGVGAVLSGSIKAALTMMVTTVMTGAADMETAKAINDLAYEGGHGADKPAGAKERLKETLDAQTKTLNLDLDTARDNLLASLAVAKTNAQRSNDTSVYVTQNNANTSFSNKNLDFQNQSYGINISNNKANYANNQALTYGKLQAGVANAQAKAINTNNYAQALENIYNNLTYASKSLINNINTKIKNFNLEMQAMLNDSQADRVLVGSQDDTGAIEAGLRDVTLTAYWQGPQIEAENKELIKRYGLTVNKPYNINNIINSLTLVGFDPSEDFYIYLKGNNLSGLWSIPKPGRDILSAALASGCCIYK